MVPAGERHRRPGQRLGLAGPTGARSRRTLTQIEGGSQRTEIIVEATLPIFETVAL